MPDPTAESIAGCASCDDLRATVAALRAVVEAAREVSQIAGQGLLDGDAHARLRDALAALPTPRPAEASDTTAPTVNRFGHVWGRGLPLDDGYARCTATVCRARENTPEAASPCQGSVAKPAVKPVLMVAPDPAPAAVIGAVMTALARPAEEA